ncbi:hypothetical protein HPB50_001973 [Hyalomma asiaticum]|uniref:Uncharacterized protein n=1 Tax=Hyalomma asiaticum TaxID=266040 RepID=A0ACB7RIE1_HYAAI|nr:hypothetical protein HPB50_001973 [Hyalomma asiaticum]
MGGTNSKDRIMMLVCANVDGSDKRSLLVIGKAKEQRGVLSMPVAYANNLKACMTSDICQWLIGFDKAMSVKKRKVLLLLDISAAHTMSMHILALLRSSSCLPTQPPSCSPWGRPSPYFTASKKTSFSPGSSTTEQETAAVDIGTAAGGAGGVMSLGQLWESAGNSNIVPAGLDYMHFALADEDLVALTAAELTASVSQKGTIGDDSASNTEGDDASAPQPVPNRIFALSLTMLRQLFFETRARETQTGDRRPLFLQKP